MALEMVMVVGVVVAVVMMFWEREMVGFGDGGMWVVRKMSFFIKIHERTNIPFNLPV